ncbi:hypothetical protein OH77DRAFT_1523159 [Trametes cingulata]|nr:hypothetical protein OH77DRAFT_1523159 [Trametes cingulata]
MRRSNCIHWAIALFALCLVLFTGPATIGTRASDTVETLSARLGARADPPRKDDGYTDVVQWDNYTLFLHGQRFFLHSGDFQTFRTPVPELWLDIFQKMVAAGLNAAGMYVHMGATNPAPGVIDFNDWRALQPIFDAAKLAGIFVVIRPGPFINSESSAGGIALWATTVVNGTLRTNASDWTAAYEPYIDGIIKEIRPNQITQGGPIIGVQIDNEYTQSPISHAEYFANLERQYREGGIVVPLTHNDASMGGNFANGTGAVDLYGTDFYPNTGVGCADPDLWSPVGTNYHAYHEATNPGEPWYMPEFQAGLFDTWGGAGYDACVQFTGPDFQDVFNKNNWASNAKMISYYAFYGGTSWGTIGIPAVYTSYDFGASIRETRALSAKYDEMKRQGMFVRSTPAFRKTDWIGDSNTGIPGVRLSTGDAFATLLRNPDTGAGFVVTRQTNSTSKANIQFNITLPTSRGPLTLPQTTSGIALNGRQSKLIVTDYTFGARSSALYSTAAVFFAGTIGTRDVLFLHGDADQSHEFALGLTGAGERVQSARVRFTASRGGSDITTVTVLPGPAGLTTVWDSDTQLILFADPVTAASFWAPPIPSQTRATVRGLENFWQFGTNETMLVGGPYLVRNASLTDKGRTLELRGDLNASVPLTVVAPPSVTAVSWNGQHVGGLRPTTDARGRGGFLTGTLTPRAAVQGVKVPALTGWMYADSLPEIREGFDDAGWVVADHTETGVPRKMEFGDGRVLYACDYGFCQGNILWRGHFTGTGLETSANLTINGGFLSTASVWLNGQFIQTVLSGASLLGPSPPSLPSSSPSLSSLLTNSKSLSANPELALNLKPKTLFALPPGTDEANANFTFPPGSVRVGEDNVLTVLMDHMGNDNDPNLQSPRGITGFRLDGGNFSSWKVQGNLGGFLHFPDRTRGTLNEGGLFGERAGWHLPSFPLHFPSSPFVPRDLSSGLPGGKAGVGFFRTTFELSIPEGLDVHVSFVFDGGVGRTGVPYRAVLWVNGWRFGKRIANFGPQAAFPVHEGILDYHGTNTVAVALWALEDTPVSPTLELVVTEVLDGGVGPIHTNNPGWTPRHVV